MKKTILLYIALFSIYVLNAQNEKISISFNNSSIIEVLEKLEQESNLKFYFQDNWFDSNKITKTYENKSVQFILSDLFSQSSINFLVYDNKVILTNNSVVYRTLPDDFFETEDQSYSSENDDIFYNQYDTKNVITVGK